MQGVRAEAVAVAASHGPCALPPSRRNRVSLAARLTLPLPCAQHSPRHTARTCHRPLVQRLERLLRVDVHTRQPAAKAGVGVVPPHNHLRPASVWARAGSGPGGVVAHLLCTRRRRAPILYRWSARTCSCLDTTREQQSTRLVPSKDVYCPTPLTGVGAARARPAAAHAVVTQPSPVRTCQLV